MVYRIYQRTSTEDQSFASQRHEIDRWLKGQADGETVRYDDHGFSRLTTDGRPGWKALLAEAQPGDLVVFYSIDRSVTDLLDYLKARAEFRGRRIGYWFIREGMGWKPGDDNNPFVEALEEILVIFGKLETRIRRARQQAGIAAARDPATGKCPWGGRRPGTRVTLTEEKEQAARAMHEAEKPISEIARVLGLTRQTVYKALGLWARHDRAG